MKHPWVPLLAFALTGIGICPAQDNSRAFPELAQSFEPVKQHLISNAAGHVINATSARQFLTEHHISPERMMPVQMVIASVENVNTSFEDDSFAQPGVHIAAMRFRADLRTAGMETEDQPDLFFTVVYVLRNDQWRRMDSFAVWDVNPVLPPNDLRYGMRPFSRELGQRLNSLPPD